MKRGLGRDEEKKKKKPTSSSSSKVVQIPKILEKPKLSTPSSSSSSKVVKIPKIPEKPKLATPKIPEKPLLQKSKSKSSTPSGSQPKPLKVVKVQNSNDDSKTGTTPRVQASKSPKIRCRSSMSSMTTPTCFGGGHVLFGVSDKRKCRPRGILTAGEELGFCKARVSEVDSDDEGLFLNKSRVSLIPVPSKASMHWLLSPCKEEGDLNGSPEVRRRLMGPIPFQSVSSSSCADGFVLDDCGNSNSSRNTGSSIKRACFISPEYATEDEDHQEYRFELDSMTEVLQKTSLSPENQTLRWNPADVLPLPGFSFQFANSASPSNFIDQVDLQKTCNDKFWQVSGSSFGNVSQSRSRISRREGLVSRIFYLNELHCCRWSSDEEADVNYCCVNDKFNSDIGCKLDKNIENDPTLISVSKSPEIVFKEPKIDVRSKGKSKRDLLYQLPNSCAESISTEGGGLITSGDSDWKLCYKNQFFRE